MKIIGHRGAKGLALENTIESIQAGVKTKADLLEFDVWPTLDNQLVLNHDPTLKRPHKVDLKIADYSLKELRIPCPNIPTLEEALKACRSTGVIIEFKTFIDPKLIFNVTDKFPKLDIKITSYSHKLIRAIKKERPDFFCYVLEHFSPFEIVNHASKIHADGIGLNFWLMNPLTYYLAMQKNLKIYTYTVNRPFIAKFLQKLYKDIDICTDYPNRYTGVEL